jgi:DNA-binding NarL/FixJ family response regulator
VDVYRPDVVLWDLGWDADELPPDFAEADYPVLALLPHDGVAADAWAAGARGLLLREAGGETLETALQAVTQGLLVLDPLLAETLRPPVPPDERPPAAELTPREQEVLQLLAEGLTNRAIAQALSISEHTVKFHVNAIMTKLNAQSRTEAVVRATRLGLILL